MVDPANTSLPRAGTDPPAIGRKGLAVAGLLLLIAWGAYWGGSLYQGKVVGTSWSWVPDWQFVGLDFLNNYHATRHWQQGGDPYSSADFGDPLQRKFAYPPIVLSLFAWCRFFSPRDAVQLWISALAGIAGIGAWVAWRTRRELQLWDLPLAFTLAAVLCSTPILYAMERGNYDLLALLLLLPALWALRGRAWWRDGLAGSCLALAAWVKIYPGILLLGLLPLRRQRAFCCGIVVALGLGILQGPQVGAFLHSARELSEQHAPSKSGQVVATVHTLSGCWNLIWTWKPLQAMAQLPPTLGAALVLAPILLWVSWRIVRCPHAVRLHYPYLLWLTGVATYLPLVSNDYNLFFVPLAALAVWDRRDPVWVHLLMAYALLWWQPLWLPVGPRLLLLTKLLALVAVGGSLVTRAAELAQAGTEADVARKEKTAFLPAAA